MAACIVGRIEQLLERRGLGPQADPTEADTLQHTQPLLAEPYGASVRGRIATGPRASRQVTAVGDRIDVESLGSAGQSPLSPRCRCTMVPRFFVFEGNNLEAGLPC